MTIEKAKEEFENYEQFAHAVCTVGCGHDWYCPSWCDVLQKGKEMDFIRILKSYARNDGDIEKVVRFIKRAKV